ncbi:membrane-associated phospholipid phosphatase [Aequorivita sublithincola DSM 14238]|uniref:Membrane-associated phospholipid phosphatase n=1 Tax=Aequorivita sublithincola (strain DSM 14238 / LMG 21431 / ACAM 643 / 9-3) TaxID=746697 RepID=I3YX62_AEQSU|nr:phosphatase PAP2 family protein [Aequorivita sublithincola]AFL81580.1 membrane-associated phospholipid phosphatase [Aequorivita sublithincola DSM 14238]
MKQSLLTFIKKFQDFLQQTFRKNNPKLPYVITILVALIIVVAGLNIFIELTETLKEEILANYDQQISNYIISFRNPSLTRYFIFMTNVGDIYGYLVVLVLALCISWFFFKNWRYVAQTVLVLMLASISNVMLKRFIDRARPGIEHLVSVETLSYPSGHAMSAMAFYGFLIYIFYRFKMNNWLKYGIILLLVFIILSIGISRIYLGVHFPSDIAGGYIAGLIWVFFCILIFNLVEVFRRDPKT